ncbi:uncharacterized protein EAE98_004632 [Botrytis deweyae]|uniref:Uncharacterized protein n=1 Tax=Botrytis deweyae TaxID=2478750 RepID=A0ABQ7IRI7_9HELO|nr:uncharacterized protein EAE98_004632 [Botrytis deweyae]KAF7931896.1 hypothetical protein EAE98_004632 [Botrytis deweyae]
MLSTLRWESSLNNGRGIACIEIEHVEMFARAFPGRRPGRTHGKSGDRERLECPGEPGVNFDRDCGWDTKYG